MIDNVSNHSLSAKHQKDIHAENRQAIDNVAKGMELQFAKLMLKQMQNTVNKSQPNSNATEIYQDMLNEEYAKAMTDKDQGLGLQQLIREQLHRQYNIPKLQANQNNSKGISMRTPRYNIGKYQKESNND